MNNKAETDIATEYMSQQQWAHGYMNMHMWVYMKFNLYCFIYFSVRRLFIIGIILLVNRNGYKNNRINFEYANIPTPTVTHTCIEIQWVKLTLFSIYLSIRFQKNKTKKKNFLFLFFLFLFFFLFFTYLYIQIVSYTVKFKKKSITRYLKL